MSSRCLLLFSLPSVREARRKRLRRAEGLFVLARDRALAAASLPGIDLVVAGELGPRDLGPGNLGPGAPARARSLPQRGTTFGERLENAFADAVALGYREIVAVGTDTPGLTAAEVEQAFTALAARPLVLGPSRDGGVYLIGLQASLLTCLANVPWQTSRVLDELGRRHPDALILPRLLSDLDGPRDLPRLLRDAGLGPEVASLVAALLHPRHDWDRTRALPPGHPLLLGVPSLRGPPLAA